MYFGEGLTSYSVVDSKVAEQEANGESSAKTTQVHRQRWRARSPSLARRLAFALRFGDFNLVYSGQVTPQSRILYLRDIQERVQTAAPFLQWDADPYAVNLERADRVGARRLHDARTSTRTRSRSTRRCRRAAVSSTNLNYVRNSVKATVDAYDGTIHFYVVDPKDPIIRTYEKAFPDLFDSVKDMPSGLQAHWRYPKTSSTRRPSSTRSTT